MEIKFGNIDRRDVFWMDEKNFRTVAYKRIPVSIEKLHVDLEVGIIDVKIPLLILKRKLKEWGGMIDF